MQNYKILNQTAQSTPCERVLYKIKTCSDFLVNYGLLTYPEHIKLQRTIQQRLEYIMRGEEVDQEATTKIIRKK